LVITKQEFGDLKGVIIGRSPAGATVWCTYEMITSDTTYLKYGANKDYGSWFIDAISDGLAPLRSD